MVKIIGGQNHILIFITITIDFKDDESIEVKWKDFFQTFEVRLKRTLEQVKESDHDKK